MDLVLEHIKNIMPQLGYSSFTWDVDVIVLNELEPTKQIMLHNEYLYIIPQAVIEGLEVYGDNEYLKTDAITTAQPISLIKPFTGNVLITIPNNTRQVLVCIKVIPKIS